jgi:protocatechuate 3,4-dioxygenase beta subunit
MADRDRRRFLLATGSIAFAGVTFDAIAQELAPTPECSDAPEPTVRQTEGPFFKPSSPRRDDLREAGARGMPVELTGLVLTRRCKPVAGAVVDLWHANENGAYDEAGFRYRGHQIADAEGRYRFRTIRPAVYAGRTAHYHVKVQGQASRLLTTQLYFPDEPANRRDRMFRSSLLMKTAQVSDVIAARFDFVLDIR